MNMQDLTIYNQELKREGITGFPTGFPTVKAETTEAAATTTETKAVPEDGKKFDNLTLVNRC